MNDYDEKIDNLKSKFFSVLDDYKKYYVYYNKNPEVNEFQNYYSNSKNQLQIISKKLYSITDEIKANIEKLDKDMLLVAKNLEEEKDKNAKLTILYNNLDNTQNGSEILITDTKSEYNKQYYTNINMFIGILIISSLLVKTFKK
jgi:hypothetical protein